MFSLFSKDTENNHVLIGQIPKVTFTSYLYRVFFDTMESIDGQNLLHSHRNVLKLLKGVFIHEVVIFLFRVSE